jgi:shikimate dehydrogenase
MTPDRYAVIGNPIEHSKSPQIHTMFARQTGQNIEYTRMLAEPPRFTATVEDFFRDGGCGLNVTVPFKEMAWNLAETRTSRAELAGAVNTLFLAPADRLRGDNTDGIGLVRDLQQNHGLQLGGRRVLLLGAGGAARGVLGPLLEAGPDALRIANRTASKAVELAQKFQHLGLVTGSGLDALSGERFDLVINATSAGLGQAVPEIPDDLLAAGAGCYDMMYADTATAFQTWGYAHGAADSWDGLGMLVEQAAEAFFVWRGVRPDTAPVINSLRSRQPD